MQSCLRAFVSESDSPFQIDSSSVHPLSWERCARLCEENKTLAPRNARRRYLLRALIRCGLCGRTCTGVSNCGRWFYYQCTSVADSCVPNCGDRRVRKAAELVADKLKDAETFLGNLARRVSTPSDEERARVTRQLVPRVVVTPGGPEGARFGGLSKPPRRPVTLGTARLRATP